MWFVLLALIPLASAGRLLPVHPNSITGLKGRHVVGGEVAPDGQWPWQGALFGATGSFTCGASLVEANWAVTAAHCIGGGTGLSVRFGSNNRDAGGQLVDATATGHPEFVNSGSTPDGAFPWDYAVLTLAEPVTVGQSIPLVANDVDSKKDDCYISGWGRLEGGGELPTDLRQVEIPVITNAECESLWGTSFNPAVHICVYDSVNQDKGGCNGDSGGPLVCPTGANGAYELYGITSWVYVGCNTAYPTAYARVSTEKDWMCGEMGNAANGC